MNFIPESRANSDILAAPWSLKSAPMVAKKGKVWVFQNRSALVSGDRQCIFVWRKPTKEKPDCMAFPVPAVAVG